MRLLVSILLPTSRDVFNRLSDLLTLLDDLPVLEEVLPNEKKYQNLDNKLYFLIMKWNDTLYFGDNKENQ